MKSTLKTVERHIPVLPDKVLDFLSPQKGKKIIDATLGDVGHSELILAKGAEVLGIDADNENIIRAHKKFPKLIAVHGNFSMICDLSKSKGFTQVDGILFDLGYSSTQLQDSKKGISFLNDGPLDMRLDPTSQGVTASDLLKVLTIKQLYELFIEYGQEKRARIIADAIVRARLVRPIETTAQLAQIVESVSPRRSGDKIHPATKVFQSLRIAINSELDNLETALLQSVELLKPGGVLVVISFHALEDKIVKNFIRSNFLLENLTAKPIVPDFLEVQNNRRSRSAKLRAAQKL